MNIKSPPPPIREFIAITPIITILIALSIPFFTISAALMRDKKEFGFVSNFSVLKVIPFVDLNFFQSKVTIKVSF